MNRGTLIVLAWLESAVLLVLRLGLGGAMAFAGVIKISDVERFALSIGKYELLDPVRDEHLVRLAAFTLPWAELMAGVLLVLGLATRGVSLLISGLMAIFLLAILSVLQRGIPLECGCFGDVSWPCGSLVTDCHAWRNAILLAAGLLLTWRGGGLIGLEAVGLDPADRFAPPPSEDRRRLSRGA